MNPKTPQDLDPKLKEAYDRVMQGSFSHPVSANNPPPPPPAPAAPSNPIAPPPSIPLTNPMMTASAPLPPLSVMSPSSAPAFPQQQANPMKKKIKISPVIFLVIGLAFFAIYAVVWAKVFKLF